MFPKWKDYALSAPSFKRSWDNYCDATLGHVRHENIRRLSILLMSATGERTASVTALLEREMKYVNSNPNP